MQRSQEKEFLRLATEFLGERLRVMGGRVPHIEKIHPKFDLRYGLLSEHDIWQEMIRLIREMSANGQTK